MSNCVSPLVNITCPFCGLACDDLALANEGNALAVTQNGCPISQASFKNLSNTTPGAAPRVAGRATTLEKAVHAAAQLMSSAQAPLISGMGTDVAGARALLALADKTGAVVDHMNMAAKLRNLLTLQNSGGITTTLAEVKNRADFVLVLGTGVVQHFPRFLERAVWPAHAMFNGDSGQRKVVFLGEFGPNDIAIPRHVNPPTVLHCKHGAFATLLPVLRALINGQEVKSSQLAPGDIAQLQAIDTGLRTARYGVIAWAAPDFNVDHGELTLQTLAELIKDINRDTRCAGLPLGGSDGDFSSNGTQTWQTGFPLRSRYGKLGIDYDPYRYGSDALLATDEVDLLLWISSFNATRTPPASSLPTIVLGPASMTFSREPDVFIPVGTPGLHHPGHFVRADKVVVMRLKQLLENTLPSVASVASKILDAL